MSYFKKVLAPGIFLGGYKDPKYKLDITSVSFVYPLSEESASLASLLSRVLTRACRDYPSQRLLNRALDALYDTELSSRTSKENDRIVCTFTVSSPCDRFSLDGTEIRKGALSVLYGIITEPYLPDGKLFDEYVQGEKKQLIDEIRSLKNQRSGYAVQRCISHMCPGEYASISSLGTEEGVARITSEELYRFYLDMMERSEIQIFSVTGGDDPEGDRFADKLALFLGPREYTPHTPAPRVIPDGVRRVTEYEHISQGNLCLGYRTDMRFSDGEYEKFLLFCELYANSPTSKLFMNVREKLSLCYYCSATGLPQSGVMLISSGIDAVNAEKAESEIEKQLSDVQNGSFTDGELEDARRFLISYLRSRTDKPGSMISWYFTRSMLGQDITPKEYIERVRKVTRQDIINVAKGVYLDTVYLMRGEDGDEV